MRSFGARGACLVVRGGVTSCVVRGVARGVLVLLWLWPWTGGMYGGVFDSGL